MNKLLDAFDKQKRAENIEGRFQEKRGKLAVAVSKAPTAKKAEKKFQRIRTSEKKAYSKLKKIESKMPLEGRPKTFIRDIETRRMIEEGKNVAPIDTYQKMIEMKRIK